MSGTEEMKDYRFSRHIATIQAVDIEAAIIELKKIDPKLDVQRCNVEVVEHG